jgi:hypothetical protein
MLEQTYFADRLAETQHAEMTGRARDRREVATSDGVAVRAPRRTGRWVAAAILCVAIAGTTGAATYALGADTSDEPPSPVPTNSCETRSGGGLLQAI